MRKIVDFNHIRNAFIEFNAEIPVKMSVLLQFGLAADSK